MATKNPYLVGQKIRYTKYSFSNRIVGYNEGTIVAVLLNSEFLQSYHCYYKLTKMVRNWDGEFKPYDIRKNETSDFFSKASNAPVIIHGHFEKVEPYEPWFVHQTVQSLKGWFI